MNSSDESTGQQISWPIYVVLATWILAVCFSCWQYKPLDVVPASAPADEFSAERAEVFFKRLYRDAEAHPAGNNDAFREKLVKEFEALGYQVTQTKRTSPVKSRRFDGDSVELTNVETSTNTLFKFPPPNNSPNPRYELLVTAHFDSHPAGPGASDDGLAVAALLEVARMLTEQGEGSGSLPNVHFLITDGEELGLLGAKQFVQYSPLANDNSLVINLEARGTTGPSLMFETSANSAWLINEYAKAVRKPATSSLFYEVYKQLPNDTDFTVFNEHGIQGWNFAFIGDVRNYHTPEDNFENADRRSLQHHGENAWRLIQQLRRNDVELPSTGRAVYFDWFNLFVVRWPAEWSIYFALLATLLAVYFSRAEQLVVAPAESNTDSPLVKLFPKWVSAVLPLFVFIDLLLLGKVLELGFAADNVFDSGVLDHPLPVQAAFWCWALVLVQLIAVLIVDRVRFRTVWLSTLFMWSVLAIASSLYVNGASYLFIIPLLLSVGGFVALKFAGRSNPIFLAAILAGCVGLVWMQLERLFYDALGFRMNVFLIGRVALVSTTLLPLLLLQDKSKRWPSTLAFLGIAGALTLWAVLAN